MSELKGWVSGLRDLGNLQFLIVRNKEGEFQVTLQKGIVPDDLFNLVKNITRESAISVKGNWKKDVRSPKGIEMIPAKIIIMNKSEVPLPMEISDKIESNLDVRLDYRFLDLRIPKTCGIFKIKGEVLYAFREFFRDRGFTEFQPPLIVSMATEGGAELFPLIYFEKQAYLAQSPQVYKEYLTCTNLERVFTITPVFRAEPHDTPRHVNQFLQADIEVAFASDIEVMNLLEEVIRHILDHITSACKEELRLLNVSIKVPKSRFPIYTYTEVLELLKEAGHNVEWGKDLSIIDCRKVEEIIGTIFYFIIDWPTAVKPFYTYPKKEDEKICHAFDLMLGAQEISSGTMRIHEYELLVKKLRENGMNLQNFKHYLELRKYGCPPHSGWSVGIERFLTKILNFENIRETMIWVRDKNRLTP